MSFNGQCVSMLAVREHFSLSHGGLNRSRTLAGMVR